MLRSLGYGGDGDEIDALAHVERAFGISFVQSDADRFVTAGDVFDAVLRKLDLSEVAGARLWPSFAAAIAGENGHNGAEIGRETLLLAEPLVDVIRRRFPRPSK